ncbi:MAG: HAMP domain-containing protein [Thermoleophilaceae bacterium]
MTVEASTAPARKATQPPHSGQASRQNGRRVDDRPLRELLDALRAARDGDFSVRLPEGRGVTGEIAAAFNQLVERNASVTEEIGRVSRLIGGEGQLTERASLDVPGGDWSTQIDSVNSLIEDLARPTTEVGRVIVAVAEGDLSQKMALEIEGQPVKGAFLRIGTTVNTMVDQLSSFADEVTRVAREVGTEGKLGAQAQVEGVSGTWRGLTENVNFMADNLTGQVRNIAQVTTAVANGDLSQKITADAKGEILELKNTINTMVDQLSSFADEVTRVAQRGRHRRQARRPGRGRGRLRHVARADRERELHGRQPHRPGPQHRPGGHRGGQRRPLPEDHRRRQGRDPRAQEHDQHHGRPALLVRRRGHPRGPRGRHRRQARRPGPGRGRLRHVARADRQREPAGGEPDHPGAGHRRGLHRGDPGRPDARDRGRRAGRARRAQGQHQPDDRQPARHHAGERRAGLAEDEPRADLGEHAGTARPRGGLQAHHVGADAGRLGSPRRVLHGRVEGRQRAHVQADRLLRVQGAQERGQPLRARRGPRRAGRPRAQADPPRQRRATTSRSPRAWARRRRST